MSRVLYQKQDDGLPVVEAVQNLDALIKGLSENIELMDSGFLWSRMEPADGGIGLITQILKLRDVRSYLQRVRDRYKIVDIPPAKPEQKVVLA